ncbi:SCP2 sterol-binding domain-containing protein [Melghirimyces algeriensis]|uniref:Sterol carrier protein n=1 Tax=Melghirimyces algeriensis TaxID=910412 RepID=A0A521AME0_9BACL|nr:SCP2 sterol-binding domain-containing protein [Melghirimyces algeriensis]SMO35973.1 Putative sterol carrier protein [Melghirimyces algeriensis]
MTVKETIMTVVDKMNKDPEGIQGMNTVYQFDIYGVGNHQLHLKNDSAEYLEEEASEANCIIQMSEENFVKLLEGNLNPTTAFMTGKLKVKGDLSLAIKLQNLLDRYR